MLPFPSLIRWYPVCPAYRYLAGRWLSAVGCLFSLCPLFSSSLQISVRHTAQLQVVAASFPSGSDGPREMAVVETRVKCAIDRSSGE